MRQRKGRDKEVEEEARRDVGGNGREGALLWCVFAFRQ